MSLNEYRKKRNFDKTAEPSGSEKPRRLRKTARMFVVQHHLASRDHYDFRLEWDGVLLSWAVPKGPSFDPRDKRLAVRVEDHPLDYARFEGLIPKGQYGGGTVQLWDEGTWTAQTDFARGLEEGSIKIVLDGARLKGKWALVRMAGEDGTPSENWLLIKEKDEYAQDDPGIAEFSTSVKTGRTTDEIERDESPASEKNPFDRVDVQLAVLADKPPEGTDWLFEMKYDGYRVVAFAAGGNVRLASRNGIDFTDKFEDVARALAKWSGGRAMVLDGEMAVADQNGRTDFQALQRYLREGEGSATYMAFDLLALDEEDLRELPLVDRKAKLEALLDDAPSSLKFSRHVRGRGKESFDAAAKAGAEGVVAKRADAPYRGGRGADWVKIKCYRRQEFVIGGMIPSEKKSGGIGALMLGYYEGNRLVYAGRTGTGIDARDAKELKAAFRKLAAARSPFESVPKAKRGEERIWLKPKLIAEVQFAEWTGENVLRQASYKGLRTDKSPEEAVFERAPAPAAPEKKRAAAKSKKNEQTLSVRGVAITSPDKIIFKNPEIKKSEVIEYYDRVSGRMLPYLKHRVLSVVRCHKGVSSACFYKKHPVAESEGIGIVPIANTEGDMSDYFYVENVIGLISEAQLGSLEFHTWGSRVEDLERPDLMVFDLDPDEGMDLARVRRGAKDLKKVLDGLALKSFVKTSGGKGYHIVVPFEPSVGWDEFHDFARRVAEVMAAKWPDRYTANIRKNKRLGKIFIDWARNGRGATSVAPYSLRARPGARVSMPISWRELDTIAPDGIDLCEALRRLKKADPWKDFFTVKQSLRTLSDPE